MSSPGCQFVDDRIAELNEEEEREQARKAHDLTPSEVALARVLGAVIEWAARGGNDGSVEADTLAAVCAPLVSKGLIFAGTGQVRSRALLDRARRAGVL